MSILRLGGTPLRFAALLLPALLLPGTLRAQEGPQGALAARYPEVHALLLETEAVQLAMIERLASDLPREATYFPRPGPLGRPVDPTLLFLEGGFPEVSAVERAAYREYQEALRSADGRDDGSSSASQATAGGRAATAPLRRMVERTHALRRAVLDIYADPQITDRVFAVREVVDAYLNDPEGALPPIPKSMNLLHLHSQANTFGINFSFLQGMLWATHWVQFAVFEPLFLLDTTEERRAGLATVADRFLDKLEVPPVGLPTEMPMAPTIAPGLRARHPELSAILDNLNLLVGIVADLLLHREVEEKDAAVAQVVSRFTDLEFEMVTSYEWTLMALRHGIFAQGGPALGYLDRSERNHPMIQLSRQRGAGSLFPGSPRE